MERQKRKKGGIRMILLERKFLQNGNNKSYLTEKESIKFHTLLKNGVDIKIRFSEKEVSPKVEWKIEESDGEERLIGIIVFPMKHLKNKVKMNQLKKHISEVSRELIGLVMEFILFNVLESSNEVDTRKNMENVRDMLNSDVDDEDITLLKKYIEKKIEDFIEHISVSMNVYLDGILRKIYSSVKERRKNSLDKIQSSMI